MSHKLSTLHDNEGGVEASEHRTRKSMSSRRPNTSSHANADCDPTRDLRPEVLLSIHQRQRIRAVTPH